MKDAGKDVVPPGGLPSRKNSTDFKGPFPPLSFFQNEGMRIDRFREELPELIPPLFTASHIFLKNRLIQILQNLGDSRLVREPFLLEHADFHSIPDCSMAAKLPTRKKTNPLPDKVRGRMILLLCQLPVSSQPDIIAPVFP